MDHRFELYYDQWIPRKPNERVELIKTINGLIRILECGETWMDERICAIDADIAIFEAILKYADENHTWEETNADTTPEHV